MPKSTTPRRGRPPIPESTRLRAQQDFAEGYPALEVAERHGISLRSAQRLAARAGEVLAPLAELAPELAELEDDDDDEEVDAPGAAPEPLGRHRLHELPFDTQVALDALHDMLGEGCADHHHVDDDVDDGAFLAAALRVPASARWPLVDLFAALRVRGGAA